LRSKDRLESTVGVGCLVHVFGFTIIVPKCDLQNFLVFSQSRS